jgi:hypothetical protein
VIIGVEEPDNQVVVTLRYDLPDPAEDDVSEGMAAHAEMVLAGQGITRAVVAGYGPDQLVTPVITALQATSLNIILLATVPAGEAVSPLAGRAALAASIAPVTGGQAELMLKATRRELAQANADPAGFTQLGLFVIQQMITRYREDSEATTGSSEAATVTIALTDLRVRDDAWSRLDPAHKTAHLRLMTDLTRLAAPGYVAGPASLLAFAAWQSGNGALANAALDRAQADNPRYSMAQLLRSAITGGAPPSMARLPMSPEEVAASYDEMEKDAAR